MGKLLVLLCLIVASSAFAQDVTTQDQVKYFQTNPSDPNYGSVRQLLEQRNDLQSKYDVMAAKVQSGQSTQAEQAAASSLDTQIKTIDGQINNFYNSSMDGVGKNTKSPCATEETKAAGTCTLGLPPGSEQALSAAIAAGTSAMQSGGTEKVCKAAKDIQLITSGLNMGHAAMCGSAIGTCVKSCQAQMDQRQLKTDPKSKMEYTLAQRSLNTCRGYEQNVAASITSGVQNLMAMATSEKCQKAVSTTPTPGPTVANTFDCSNPMMASQAQCICSKNPHDPICSASGTAGLQAAQYGSDGGANSALGAAAKDPSAFGFGDGISKLDPSNAGAAGGGAPSAGGGGGMAGGAGAQPLPPEDTGGPNKGPYNTDIMGGTTGGSGGGGYLSSGGSSSGSGGGGFFSSLADKLNLKGFLPSKADFKNRGLASGSGADGITGPNGPSLFEKVSSMYHKKQTELLP